MKISHFIIEHVSEHIHHAGMFLNCNNKFCADYSM